MNIQLAQHFSYTMTTMEGKNNDAMAETNPFETSFIYLFITQDESRE